MLCGAASFARLVSPGRYDGRAIVRPGHKSSRPLSCQLFLPPSSLLIQPSELQRRIT